MPAAYPDTEPNARFFCFSTKAFVYLISKPPYMKRKNLLFTLGLLFSTALWAQEKQVTGYAITPAEKGGRNWKELRRIDATTGQVLETIYQSNQQIEMLNARTGKPIMVKETPAPVPQTAIAVAPTTGTTSNDNVQRNYQLVQDGSTYTIKYNDGRTITVHSRGRHAIQQKTEMPFATQSAACAYDKKHERLYYTPMGINQLRYFDLKSKTPKVYYFEEEAFGNVKGYGDAENQITRMVIASDGNGYALSNDANHLIRFTTGKKPEISDLGALTDDAANGKHTIHHRYFHGGDMIADADKNLYLISANRYVFKINIESRVAVYKGAITGLPPGYTTNGAMVEAGSKVILASSESTEGYYRFDLNTLEAEKMAAASGVYNASDLANGNLAFAKKKEKKETPPVVEEKKPVLQEEVAAKKPVDQLPAYNIGIFPNPVTNGSFQLSFNSLPAARYVVQIFDFDGRLVQTQDVLVQNEKQVANINLPAGIAKGTYLVNVSTSSSDSKLVLTEKLTVQ
jgi:methionine-rich copper-binding protein CopC